MLQISAFIRDLWRTQRGGTAIIVALLSPVLIGIGGYAIDLGHTAQVQRMLQEATDSAALAGAYYINSTTVSPTATSTSYSAVSGNKNAVPGAAVTMVSGYPQLKCLKSTGVSCTGPNSANAIQVKQQATVQTWFSGIFGIDSMTVTASATAGAGGGQALPLDIMVIVDTTASMNTADTSCSVAGATRLTCALAGLRTLLLDLNTSDDVGLMVFPGLQNASQAAYDYACNSTDPKTVAYNKSPLYQVLGLSNNFKTSSTSTSLNTASDLVLAAQGGPSGCTEGLKAVGGYGTYYADVITAAQTALTTNGRADVQKVIILLSDGDANASSSNVPTGKGANQCHEAITAAKAATAAGTWVYALAYGSPTAATPGSCSTDSPAISACSTMQQIASEPGFFYSDQTGGTSSCTSTVNSVSELVSLFNAVGVSFQKPRMLLDSTS